MGKYEYENMPKGHILNHLIGKRFRLTGDHPYAGCHGEIVRIGDTAFGKRPVLKLDSEFAILKGVSECCIMNSRQAAKELRAKKKT